MSYTLANPSEVTDFYGNGKSVYQGGRYGIRALIDAVLRLITGVQHTTFAADEQPAGTSPNGFEKVQWVQVVCWTPVISRKTSHSVSSHPKMAASSPSTERLTTASGHFAQWL
jgi:hypothetical protein